MQTGVLYTFLKGTLLHTGLKDTGIVVGFDMN
jgi:hypothetical protein